MCIWLWCYVECTVACLLFLVIFFFKQKTAYEMRMSDWSSDVCSSDLDHGPGRRRDLDGGRAGGATARLARNSGEPGRVERLPSWLLAHVSLHPAGLRTGGAVFRTGGAARSELCTRLRRAVVRALATGLLRAVAR